MKRVTIISILLLASIISCDVFSEKGAKVKEIPAFEWRKIHRFASDTISFIHITANDELFVGTLKAWYRSSDYGETFTHQAVPDTVIFKLVKKFGNHYYALGEYDIETTIWSSSITVTSDGLFRSNDGSSWEQLLGPFWMYDIVLDEFENLYVAKYLGVSKLHLPTMEETLMEFMPESSNLEFANVLSKNNKGEIYVGTDLGLYRTKNQGENWDQLIQSGGSFLDDIEQIELIENKIIAISTKELWVSDDNGESWVVNPMVIYGSNVNYATGYYYRDIDFNSTGHLYASTSYGVGVGKADSLSKIHIAGPAGYDLENSFNYSLLEVFSNGDVAVANGNQILIGTRNLESEFWN